MLNFVTVKIILKSGIETFSQNSHIQQKYIDNFDFYLYCFHDKMRIFFMSFIVQISPFVHLFTLKIVFHWGANPNPHQGSSLDLLGALSGPQTPLCKLCLLFILYLATPPDGNGNDDFIAVAYVFSVFCNHAGVLHCHFHFLSLTYLP
jgi:hypothetical protein